MGWGAWWGRPCERRNARVRRRLRGRVCTARQAARDAVVEGARLGWGGRAMVWGGVGARNGVVGCDGGW